MSIKVVRSIETLAPEEQIKAQTNLRILYEESQEKIKNLNEQLAIKDKTIQSLDTRIDSQQSQIVMLLKNRNGGETIQQTSNDLKKTFTEKLKALETDISYLTDENEMLRKEILANLNKKSTKTPSKTTKFDQSTDKQSKLQQQKDEMEEKYQLEIQSLKNANKMFLKYKEDNIKLEEININFREECALKDEKIELLQKANNDLELKIKDQNAPTVTLSQFEDLKKSHNNVLTVFQKLINDVVKFSENDISLEETGLVFHNKEIKTLMIEKILDQSKTQALTPVEFSEKFFTIFESISHSKDYKSACKSIKKDQESKLKHLNQQMEQLLHENRKIKTYIYDHMQKGNQGDQNTHQKIKKSELKNLLSNELNEQQQKIDSMEQTRKQLTMEANEVPKLKKLNNDLNRHNKELKIEINNTNERLALKEMEYQIAKKRLDEFNEQFVLKDMTISNAFRSSAKPAETKDRWK